MDINNSNTDKKVTTEAGNQTGVPVAPPPAEPRYYSAPPETPYYSYGGYPPVEPKKRKGPLIIVLSSCLGVLAVILIALCVILFVNSTDKPDGKDAVDLVEEADTTVEEPQKVEFVTYISDARVFVRSGPGTGYSKLMAIAAGDRSVRLEYTQNSQTGTDGYTWYEVKLPTGEIGWVRSDVVIVYNGADTPIRASIKTNTSTKYSSADWYLVTNESKSSIYVRSGPGKSYTILKKIGPGDTSVRLAYNNYSQYGQDGYIWYSVTLPNGKSAWVRSDIVRWIN